MIVGNVWYNILLTGWFQLVFLCSLVREEISVIKTNFAEREALRTAIEDGSD